MPGESGGNLASQLESQDERFLYALSSLMWCQGFDITPRLWQKYETTKDPSSVKRSFDESKTSATSAKRNLDDTLTTTTSANDGLPVGFPQAIAELGLDPEVECQDPAAPEGSGSYRSCTSCTCKGSDVNLELAKEKDGQSSSHLPTRCSHLTSSSILKDNSCGIDVPGLPPSLPSSDVAVINKASTKQLGFHPPHQRQSLGMGCLGPHHPATLPLPPRGRRCSIDTVPAHRPFQSKMEPPLYQRSSSNNLTLDRCAPCNDLDFLIEAKFGSVVKMEPYDIKLQMRRAEKELFVLRREQQQLGMSMGGSDGDHRSDMSPHGSQVSSVSSSLRTHFARRICILDEKAKEKSSQLESLKEMYEEAINPFE